MEDEKKVVAVFNCRQWRFIREIERLNYTQDEAYAEVINNKNRYRHYDEFDEVILYWFNHKSNELWDKEGSFGRLKKDFPRYKISEYYGKF